MKKDIILFIVIFVIFALVGGGTYAYWSWSSDTRKFIGFQAAADLDEYIVYNAGESHFVGDFQPSANYCHDSIYNTISVGKTIDATDMMLVSSIKLDVNAIGSYISNSDDVHWVVIEGGKNDCLTSSAIASGIFKGISKDTTLTLTSNRFVSTASQQYTIYIWIDSSGDNLSNLSGETIDVNIWTQIDQVAAWYGDINLDGKVDSDDSLLIKRYVAGLEQISEQAKKNADVNIDGVVDDKDFDLVSAQIAGSVLYEPLRPYLG